MSTGDSDSWEFGNRLRARSGVIRHDDDGALHAGVYVWPIPSAGDRRHEEQHLDLVSIHPAFAADVAQLRSTLDDAGIDRESIRRRPPHEVADPTLTLPASQRTALEKVAQRWRITLGDLFAYVLAKDETVHLPDQGDKVFLEARPDAWILRVPRPITPSREMAVIAWLEDERERQIKAAKAREYTPPLHGPYVELFRRYLCGETVADIWESSAADLDNPSQDAFVKGLQRIDVKLRALSGEGMPPRPTWTR